MARHSKIRIIQAIIVNGLLMIIIALMIASIFSVLLIKGVNGQTPRESEQSLFVTSPAD